MQYYPIFWLRCCFKRNFLYSIDILHCISFFCLISFTLKPFPSLCVLSRNNMQGHNSGLYCSCHFCVLLFPLSSQEGHLNLCTALPSKLLLRNPFITMSIPKNKILPQHGVQWQDQAPLYHFCVLLLPIRLSVWTHLLSPFVPSWWTCFGVQTSSFFFLLFFFPVCIVPNTRVTHLSTPLGSTVTIHDITITIINEVPCQSVIWGSSFCYFSNEKYPYICCSTVDIENRSITSWFLYIISTYQNIQIGAFPLKKSHRIDEPESAYINVLA